MPTVRCPYCQESLKVPNTLAGCLVRCHDCDGVMRAPQLDTDDAAIAVAVPEARVHEGTTRPNEEVQEYVKGLEKRAQEEAERKPNYRRRIPVDLIAGLIFVVGGVALMPQTFLGGAILMLVGAFFFLYWIVGIF